MKKRVQTMTLTSQPKAAVEGAHLRPAYLEALVEACQISIPLWTWTTCSS